MQNTEERLEEICCLANSSEKPSTNPGEKKHSRSKTLMDIIRSNN